MEVNTTRGQKERRCRRRQVTARGAPGSIAPMGWGFVWLMFALKIPILALGWIVWWAIRQEPEPVKGGSGEDGGEDCRGELASQGSMGHGRALPWPGNGPDLHDPAVRGVSAVRRYSIDAPKLRPFVIPRCLPSPSP